MDVESAAARDSGSGSNPARAADARQVADIVDRLGASDRLDAATRGQLLADLAQANPAVLPQLTEALAAAAQYADRRPSVAPAEPIDESPGRTADQPPPRVAPPARAADSRPNVLRDERSRAPAAFAAPPAAANVALASASTPASASSPQAAPSSPQAAPPRELVQTAADDDWQTHLAAAIAALERDAVETPQSPAELQQQVQLRLLRLAAGDAEGAARAIPGVPPAEQEYWSEQLYALSVALDDQKLPDAARRAAAANVHLRAAATRLADRATLAVRNLTFCTEVKGYGAYTPFPKYDFRASQKLVLYVEVENFQSESTDTGHRTALRASYRLLDGKGERIDSKEFGVEEDLCKNLRRDLSLRYYLWMPARLEPGSYTLELTVEDTLGHKFGSSTVEFQAVR